MSTQYILHPSSTCMPTVIAPPLPTPGTTVGRPAPNSGEPEPRQASPSPAQERLELVGWDEV